ncbi:MAG: large conductance mechanosensitive channel protein MscL [Erysipelotrichaceae bacterium]|nr:large conductance mechanosensitive channel protein MscL [Erysipelotrichaceae bacterium]MBP5279367.1 large conductance mechanosensitive channel protein MscL [Erysipelotrichaceae bacterium]
MKQFIKEFREFIAKGNVLDLAIGVVIGGAFQAIVNSLVNDVIMPIVGAIIGGLDFSAIAIPLGGDAMIMIGNFIQAVVNFLIVALVLFTVIKAINKFKRAEPKPEEKPAEPSDEVKLLQSIEAELKKLNEKPEPAPRKAAERKPAAKVEEPKATAKKPAAKAEPKKTAKKPAAKKETKKTNKK